MKPSRPSVEIVSQEQTPLYRGSLCITPQTQVVTVRLPGALWRWTRPQALLVQDGTTLRRLAVPDWTRHIYLASLGMVLCCWLISLCKRRQVFPLPLAKE